jgi:hypothetical protein
MQYFTNVHKDGYLRNWNTTLCNYIIYMLNFIDFFAHFPWFKLTAEVEGSLDLRAHISHES